MVNDDEVVRCLEEIRDSFDAVTAPMRSLLRNGKVEILLKAWLAARWIGTSGLRRCLMDKEFNEIPIDLLALERDSQAPAAYGVPRFWMETKCTFAEDLADVDAATERVLAQIWRYAEKLRESPWQEERYFKDRKEVARDFRNQLLGRPVYIVHFLNSMPTEEDWMPEIVTKKFRAKQRTDAEDLKQSYALPRAGAARIERLKQKVQNARDDQTRGKRAKKRLVSEQASRMRELYENSHIVEISGRVPERLDAVVVKFASLAKVPGN